MEGQSEAKQATQTQVMIVFDEIKAAVRAVGGSVAQVPDSADLKGGDKKVWIVGVAM